MTSVGLTDLLKRLRAQRPFVRWFIYALLLTLMLQSVGAMIDFSNGFSRGFSDAYNGTHRRP
jgi:hypothetical protein